jgi:hypothetical protein
MSIRRSLPAALAALVLAAPAVLAAPEKVVPDRNWTAVIRDEKLKSAAPKSGLITDAKTFEKVWKAWRKDEKVPAIDFKKSFVLVTFASGPNVPSITATLDDGKMTIRSIQTLIGGEGFGYSLAVFPRKGVKTVQGKELP